MEVSVLHNERTPSPRVLAPILEECGYQRLWFGEHHAEDAIPNPTIATAIAATSCQEMRVGTAGVLLRTLSPYRIAEDFGFLAREFSGRIDLGVVSAVPRSPLLNAICSGESEEELNTFEQQVRCLADLLAGKRDDVIPSPFSESKPQLWICGMSATTAKLAGNIGAGFAFHEHFARVAISKGKSIESAQRVFGYYRDSYATQMGGTPRTAIACYGMSAANDVLAGKLWSSAFECDNVPNPDFHGSAHQCVEQLQDVLADSGADELVIRCLCMDDSALTDAYMSVADIAGLTVAGNVHTGCSDNG